MTLAGFIAGIVVLVFITLHSLKLVSFFGFNWTSIQGGTFRHRAELWAAAIAMIKDSPIYGQGFFSYEEKYYKFRTLESVLRVGEERIPDSPHNELLELGVNFGIIGIVLVSVFLLMIGRKSFNYVTARSADMAVTDDSHLFVIIIFVGLLIQRMIGPFSVSLSSIFFTSAGLIWYRFYKNDKTQKTNESFLKLTYKFKNQTSKLIALLLTIVTFLPVYRDWQFLYSARNQDDKRVLSIVNYFPKDKERYLITFDYFLSTGNFEYAKMVSYDAHQSFMNDPRLLEIYLDLHNLLSSAAELNKLRNLNPFFEINE